MIPRSSRRGFLSSLASSVTAGMTAGCRAFSGANPPAPSEVIDTHTHFYDPFRSEGVPWPPEDDPVLYRTVLPRDYPGLPVPHPVTGTVVVEASPWVEDNQWVLDLAAREPFILGFVGNLPVGTASFAGHFERFAAQPLFRGLRLRDVDLNEALQKPGFREDVQRIADRGLTVDLVGSPSLLVPAERLARQFPGLRIVLDHLAGVPIDGCFPPADWLAEMDELARCDNVSAKVSGLVEGTGRRGGQAPDGVEFYRPVLDAMWERFGPDRLVYASNWPVCEHFAPLGTVQSIASDYFQAKGGATWEKVFAKNAAAIYRWPTPAATLSQA